MSAEPPPEVRELAAQRADARTVKDFAVADALRDRIAGMGWTVVDQPDGWRLEPATAELRAPTRLRAQDVPSILHEAPTDDVSLHWVVEGWPQDVVRAIASFRANERGRRVQCVVADVTGTDPGTFGDDVELVSLREGTGWAAARNAGLRRSTGRIVIALDGSIEAVGDVFGPIQEALADETIGVCGPFGIVTEDLRQFNQAPGPACDAVEGYFMAMRREVLTSAGLFDEKFRWYRTADVEYSFRVKDAGLRTVMVDVPVRKHEHRMWFETDPAERAKWSKRNFYRFLDRYRDRYDLTLAGEPPVHDHERDGG